MDDGILNIKAMPMLINSVLQIINTEIRINIS